MIVKIMTLLFVFLCISCGESPSEPARPAFSKEDCAKKDFRRAVGSVVDHYEYGGLYVYVKRTWYERTLQEKQGIAAFIVSCGPKDFIDIYDAHTGKKLAVFGNDIGYQNYEG